MITFGFFDERVNYATLALNQHLTTEDLQERIDNLKNRIEYSDAYISCREYRSEIRVYEGILDLRKQYGVL